MALYSNQNILRRSARRDAGLCTSCGKPKENGFMQCSKCRAYTAEKQKEIRSSRLRQRLCFRCGKSLGKQPQLYCAACRDIINAQARDLASQKRASGICPHCGKPALAGYTTCAEYRGILRTLYHKRRAKRISAGVCTDCGKPLESGHGRYLQCHECRTRHSENYRNLKASREAQGICTTCGIRVAVAGGKHCRECIKRRSDSDDKCKLEVMQYYGDSKCVKCGNTDLDCLTIHHVNGGGNAHRRNETNGSGGKRFYRWLKRMNFPSGYMVMCYNCHAKHETSEERGKAGQ